jgi:hemoglobin
LKTIKAARPEWASRLFSLSPRGQEQITARKKMMKRIALTFCLLMVFASVASAQTSPNSTHASMAGAMQDKKSLYDRLGGYNAIAAVTDDFVGRLVADKRLNRFFVGHSTDSLKKIRMHVINQLCEAAGGPCNYTGRDMKTAHAGLGITGEEWDISAKHLVDTLNKFKVGKAEQDELLAVISSLKKDIVDKP